MFQLALHLALVTFTLAFLEDRSPLSASDDSSCLNLLTFNAGLTPRIPDYAKRSAAIPGRLLKEDADMICLQEYWFEQDIQPLLSVLQDKYPYHYSAIHKGVSNLETPAADDKTPKFGCSSSDVGYFKGTIVPCGKTNGCFKKFASSAEEGLACLTAKCSAELKSSSINPDCISCIIMSASSPNVKLDWCIQQTGQTSNRFNAPGLVLLSKKRFTGLYHSYQHGARMALQRGHIEAEVDDVGVVVCTHLTSVRPLYFEYDLNYKSYEEQQEAEIYSLQEEFGSMKHVLIGDLNMGPRVSSLVIQKNLKGESAENFDKLMGMGYETTYLKDDGRCTFCKDVNPYTSTQPTKVIDYVLLHKFGKVSQRVKRIFDEVSPFPLSDHFGVKSTVCPA